MLGKTIREQLEELLKTEEAAPLVAEIEKKSINETLDAGMAAGIIDGVQREALGRLRL